MQRAQNLHKYRSIIYGAMAIGNLAISIWLCQYLGAIGCAIGTAVARRAGKRARDEHLLSAAAEHRRDRVLEKYRAHGARPAGRLPRAAC